MRIRVIQLEGALFAICCIWYHSYAVCVIVVIVMVDQIYVASLTVLTHRRPNELPYAIYCKILILILGLSGCVI